MAQQTSRTRPPRGPSAPIRPSYVRPVASTPHARRGIRLARLFGVEVRLDVSLIVIFSLVVYSLGAGVFSEWHPGWSSGLRWMTALGAGAAFFASLLAHEFAHSLVAIRAGIPVPRITLFLFGGVSELSREPDSPRDEFLIAIVGPLMSFGLGLLFTTLGMAIAGGEFVDALVQEPTAAIAGLGPLATLCLWLGPINVVLAAFNLVPAFPLDGGRVLRALLWSATGDRMRASLWASAAGRVFAVALVAVGILQVLHGDLAGLWFVLIGWFIGRAARDSRTQAVLQRAIAGQTVGDLMCTRFDTVDAQVTVERLIDNFLLRGEQVAWPVVEGASVVGLVTLDDVRAISEEDRRLQRVRDVMQPVGTALTPEQPAQAGVRMLGDARQAVLPVVDGDTVVGLLHASDVLRWIALHSVDT